MRQNLFDRLGGDTLRTILADFYDRLFADAMIGFVFDGKDKARLIEKEWELTAKLLGADVAYTGRSLASAHGPHRIFGGQFDRRMQILRETLADHHVADDIAQTWLGDNAKMRAVITPDKAGSCGDPESRPRKRLPLI